MKKIVTIIVCLLMFSACKQNEKNGHEHHSMSEKSNIAKISKSPHKSSMANVGNVHVHIEYNSPSVRNRIIWGGLVPYDIVWVTGAHMATCIHFFGEVQIAGQSIPEGKYAFFSIPGETEWTLILNKNWEQHHTDENNPEEDVFRWKVKPETTGHQEALSYEVIGGEEGGSIVFQWEKIKFNFDLKI